MTQLADDRSVIQQVLDHIDGGTTDLAAGSWREPVEHYRSPERLELELERVLRRTPTPFCPSAALAEPGAYIAREAAGVPLLVVRARDGVVRAFRNACRHRGVQLAEGSGCATAFVCPYHGWVYGQDGALRHIPDAAGFPDVDPATRGLVPVRAEERHGLVFVTQDGPAEASPELDVLAGVLTPDLRLHSATITDVAANWKIFMDGFLEGYHLRATHKQTFYPLQFDNLNVVEHFGRNTRIVFPYRRIEKQRALPPADRSPAGSLTYVYHLFPNAVVATFPVSVSLIINEPVGVDRTRVHNYILTTLDVDDPEATAALKRGVDLQVDGLSEDLAMAHSIQRGLASGANEHFEFGRYEGALTHFHRGLAQVIDG
ncbi:aromatic ring-hydroxylating oxygenase subunit alpha [Pseudonocardia sp. TRM90224]|uniref:aromatic ring-hydroxylating oxygenase subunit alpha n=1 Tax=Pseudonocardia sp. TRM90224 TaxID=2812678 RepID=UPI001E5A0739|nr:SRPBCC family protein [Pseudonocardia sp. TRM90224]